MDTEIRPNLISHVAISTNDTIAVVTTYQGEMSFEILARGFLEMAHNSLQSSTSIDSTTAAILYALRHSAELFLKHVILDVSENGFDIPSIETIRTLGSHKLLDLWKNNKSIIEIFFKSDSYTRELFDYRLWILNFEFILNEFEAIDKNGQTLRYPTATDGKPNLGGTTEISLGQIKLFVNFMTQCFDDYRDRDC